MRRRTTCRVLVAGAFLLSMMIGADVTAQTGAQTMPHPSTSAIPQTPSSKSGQKTAIENNPASRESSTNARNWDSFRGNTKKIMVSGKIALTRW